MLLRGKGLSHTRTCTVTHIIMKRTRLAHEDGYALSWTSDEDDGAEGDDEDDAEAANVLRKSAPCPPATISQTEWDDYRSRVEERRCFSFRNVVPPEMRMPLGISVPIVDRSPHDIASAVDHPNTRILNVKQPWASFIAMGVKDVENRSKELKHNDSDEKGGGRAKDARGGHTWVLILSSAKEGSAPKWTKSMQDAEARMYWNGGYASTDLPVVGRDRSDFPYQRIVALAKLRCSSKRSEGRTWTGKQSIWNKGDWYAWEVLEVHSLLHDPVPFGKGFQTPGVLATPKTGDESGFYETVREEVKRRLLLGKKDPSSWSGGASSQEARLSPPPPTGGGFEDGAATMMTSLDRVGCATVVLPDTVVRTRDFLNKLNRGTRAWFGERMDEAVQRDSSSKKTALNQTWWQQRRTWNETYDQTRRDEILRVLDPGTSSGLSLIHGDDATRRKALPADVADFLSERVSFVKKGDCNMALGNMHKAWTLKGFGKWARIHPGAGMDVTRYAMDLLRSQGIEAGLKDVLPHIIYKPPNGSKLPAHHDQMPTEELLRNLRSHVASEDPSMSAWARKHGVQALCHVEGGVHDGYTYTIGPLTPLKLLICLELLYTKEVPGAFKNKEERRKWMTATEGPYFVDWTSAATLATFNLELDARGLDPIRQIPIRPSGTKSVGAYVAFWPVGVPHGSSSNKTRRVTISLPINTTGKTLPSTARSKRRAVAIAEVASSDATHKDRIAAEEWLAKDTVPYSDGPTHCKPQYVSEYMRADTGPYADLAPTREQARAYAESG